MPNQHRKQAITVRIDPTLLEKVRAKCAETGDTITSLVDKVFSEYVTPPPPRK